MPSRAVDCGANFLNKRIRSTHCALESTMLVIGLGRSQCTANRQGEQLEDAAVGIHRCTEGNTYYESEYDENPKDDSQRDHDRL